MYVQIDSTVKNAWRHRSWGASGIAPIGYILIKIGPISATVFVCTGKCVRIYVAFAWIFKWTMPKVARSTTRRCAACWIRLWIDDESKRWSGRRRRRWLATGNCRLQTASIGYSSTVDLWSCTGIRDSRWTQSEPVSRWYRHEEIV